MKLIIPSCKICDSSKLLNSWSLTVKFIGSNYDSQNTNKLCSQFKSRTLFSVYLKGILFFLLFHHSNRELKCLWKVFCLIENAHFTRLGCYNYSELLQINPFIGVNVHRYIRGPYISAFGCAPYLRYGTLMARGKRREKCDSH